jgi:hypothetical protein
MAADKLPGCSPANKYRLLQTEGRGDHEKNQQQERDIDHCSRSLLTRHLFFRRADRLLRYFRRGYSCVAFAPAARSLFSTVAIPRADRQPQSS